MPDGVPDDAGSDGGSVDPRYDPAFQRGYSGDVTSAPRGQSTLRRTAAVNPARPAPSVTPPPSLDISAPPARVETPEAVGGGFAPAESVGPGTEGSFAPVSPRELARNPFVVALAALAAVLIVAGAVWAVQGFSSIAKNGGTRNEVEFWAAQTMSFGAPLAIIVGLALVGVLLAQFARAWQRGQR